MDTNKIMTDEEVIETTVEITEAGSGKSFKVAAGIGLAVFTGVMVYKYVAKPLMVKIKAQKEQQKIYEEDFDYFDDYVEEEKLGSEEE